MSVNKDRLMKLRISRIEAKESVYWLLNEVCQIEADSLSLLSEGKELKLISFFKFVRIIEH